MDKVSNTADNKYHDNSVSGEESSPVTLELSTSEEYRALYLEAYSDLSEHRDFIVESLKDKYQSLSDEEIYSDYVKSITDHFKRCPGCSKIKGLKGITGEYGFISHAKRLLERAKEKQQSSFNLRKIMLEENVDTDQLTIDDFIKEYYWYYFMAPIGRFGEFLYCNNVHQKAQFIVDILDMSDILHDHPKITQYLEEYGND